MRRHQLEEVRLRNFRCFHQLQTASLAPLTLLVGDNSTGKTSFLAAVRAIWEAAFRSIEPDFRSPPYDLGAFSEIVHTRTDEQSVPASFEIGFTGHARHLPVKFDVTFRSRAAAPSPSSISWDAEGIWIKYPIKDGARIYVDFGSANGEWRIKAASRFSNAEPFSPSWIHWVRRTIHEIDESPDRLEKLNETTDSPTRGDLNKIVRLLRDLSLFSPVEPPFASAPIRSSPRRTYDPTKPSPDPEGAYVPTYFASVHFRDQEQWGRLKDRLERFGRESGLFHEIGVKQLGDMEGGPFQLEIRKYGKAGRSRKRNLIDVGYGVSQVLPVLAELFRPKGSSVFLLQQPEVHLHPRAQAALGSLFCETAASGTQVIVETHSDYIVDRVLLDIRDGRTDLRSKDVRILYFERQDEEVSIHAIRVDDEGNVLDTPDGYRSFFKDELARVIEY